MFDWLDTIGDFISDGWDFLVDGAKSVGGDLMDAISGSILDALSSWIGSVLYAITCAFMKLVQLLYSLFGVFSGISKIKYDGNATYLTNIFFENDAISGVYWGMVLLGFVLMFAFAIVSIVRKMFDLYDKQQHSIGQILGNCFKAFLVMISMTMVMTATITLTNELIRRVNYIFDRNKALLTRDEIEFTDEQFATMARIYNTIGNYSLNPSYAQRFNLNSCYNELRGDLLYLQNQGVFDLIYSDEDEEGNPDPTWQSELQRLVQAADPRSELKMDPYYTQVYNVLENIMTLLRTDPSFFPLERYENQFASTSVSVSLDRILFLTGTMEAARNSAYNKDPAIDDGLRGAFYTGEKSIYSMREVSSAFDISLSGINYLLIWFLAYHVARSLYHCILNCGARLINMVGLYLIAPPIAAVMPLDDGQKFREWVTSMVIQALGIFGNIIPMRLFILFVPLILDSRLVILPNVFLNLAAKVVLIVALIESVEKFGAILTGILANSAGSAAIRASGLDEEADKYFNASIGKLNPLQYLKKGGGGGGGGGGASSLAMTGGAAAAGGAAAGAEGAAASGDDPVNMHDVYGGSRDTEGGEGTASPSGLADEAGKNDSGRRENSAPVNVRSRMGNSGDDSE